MPAGTLPISPDATLFNVTIVRRGLLQAWHRLEEKNMIAPLMRLFLKLLICRFAVATERPSGSVLAERNRGASSRYRRPGVESGDQAHQRRQQPRQQRGAWQAVQAHGQRLFADLESARGARASEAVPNPKPRTAGSLIPSTEQSSCTPTAPRMPIRMTGTDPPPMRSAAPIAIGGWPAAPVVSPGRCLSRGRPVPDRRSD